MPMSNGRLRWNGTHPVQAESAVESALWGKLPTSTRRLVYDALEHLERVGVAGLFIHSHAMRCPRLNTIHPRCVETSSSCSLGHASFLCHDQKHRLHMNEAKDNVHLTLQYIASANNDSMYLEQDIDLDGFRYLTSCIVLRFNLTTTATMLRLGKGYIWTSAEPPCSNSRQLPFEDFLFCSAVVICHTVVSIHWLRALEMRP